MTPPEIVPGVEPSDLADTSALARVPHHLGVREALIEPLSMGAIAYCGVTLLEMGMTAPNLVSTSNSVRSSLDCHRSPSSVRTTTGPGRSKGSSP